MPSSICHRQDHLTNAQVLVLDRTGRVCHQILNSWGSEPLRSFIDQLPLTRDDLSPNSGSTDVKDQPHRDLRASSLVVVAQRSVGLWIDAEFLKYLPSPYLRHCGRSYRRLLGNRTDDCSCTNVDPRGHPDEFAILNHGANCLVHARASLTTTIEFRAQEGALVRRASMYCFTDRRMVVRGMFVTLSLTRICELATSIHLLAMSG